MNLADLVCVEVAGVISSATSQEEQEQKHSYDEKTLVQDELVETSPNSLGERNTGQPKTGKRGGWMLVTGKAHLSLP